jgi:hypothetical protein
VSVASWKITDAPKKMTVSRCTVVDVAAAANVADGKMTGAELPVSAAGEKLDNRLEKLDDRLIPAPVSHATTNVTH